MGRVPPRPPKGAGKKKPPKPKGKKKPPSRPPSKPEEGDSDDLIEHYAGRRSILTDEVVNDLVKVIGLGNYFVTAINYAGISESAFYSWKARGEEEIRRLAEIQDKTGVVKNPARKELIYVEFLESIKKAEAKSEVVAVIEVKSAFKEDWKAAMTFLERRFPDRWKRKDRYELTGPDGKDLVPVVVYIPDNGRDKKK